MSTPVDTPRRYGVRSSCKSYSSYAYRKARASSWPDLLTWVTRTGVGHRPHSSGDLRPSADRGPTSTGASLSRCPWTYAEKLVKIGRTGSETWTVTLSVRCEARDLLGKISKINPVGVCDGVGGHTPQSMPNFSWCAPMVRVRLSTILYCPLVLDNVVQGDLKSGSADGGAGEGQRDADGGSRGHILRGQNDGDGKGHRTVGDVIEASQIVGVISRPAEPKLVGGCRRENSGHSDQ